jgi:hypothetical protein
LIVVPVAARPGLTFSMPPLLIVVPSAVPPMSEVAASVLTFSTPPLLIVVPRASQRLLNH